MNKQSYLWIIGGMIAGGLLAACGSGQQETPIREPDQPLTAIASEPAPILTNVVTLPTSTISPLATQAVTKIPPPSNQAPGAGMPAADAMPIEPQTIEFQAQDGQSLRGRYFPAAVSPAPLVILMHWAPGDQNNWIVIADWLQNRMVPPIALRGQPWQNSTWFPALPEGLSIGVFTFTFRDCDGGCKSFTRDEWLLDAQAAMQTTRQLEGVDPGRVVAIGASIGADGAADGCSWLNSQYPDSCLGALSLSPGGYLTIPYDEAVSALGSEPAPKPAWCLYAEGDVESRKACEAAKGDNYQAIRYPGSNHGMMLINPDAEPNPLAAILDFLQFTLGK